MIKCWNSNQAIGTDAGGLDLDGHQVGGGRTKWQELGDWSFDAATEPTELTLSVRAASPTRRWQNLPQRRRNMYFMFELHNAIKAYNGNDGCPPGRRDLTEVRCPPHRVGVPLARVLCLLAPGSRWPHMGRDD